MSNNDEVIKIPVDLDFGPAQSTITEEQARLAQAFQRVPGMGGLDFNTIRQVVNSPDFGDAANVRGAYPQVGKALDRYNRFATTGQTDDQSAEQKKKQTTQDRENFRQSQELAKQRRQAEQDEIRAIRARIGSLSSMGVFSPGSGMGNMRKSFAESVITMVGGGNFRDTTFGAILSGGRRGGGAVGNAAGGMAGRAILPTRTGAGQATAEAGANTEAAVAGATVGGGIADALGTVFWPALVAAAGIGVVQAGSSLAATVETSRRALTGAIADAGDGSHLYNGVLDQAQNFIVDPDVAQGVATQLGGMGVKGPDAMSNVGNALALTRIAPAIPQASANQLVGSLSTQGGMSASDIGTVLDTLRKTSDVTGISLEKMVNNLLDFEKATNGAALNLKSINEWLAEQAVDGTSVNTLAASAPGINAQGTDAMKQGAILGLTPTQYTKLQQDPAAFQKKAMAWLRQGTQGLPQADAVELMEARNSVAGFFDTSYMSSQQATTFYTTGRTPAQTAALAAKQRAIAAIGKGASLADWLGTGKAAAGEETSVGDKVENTVKIAGLKVVNGQVGQTGQSSGTSLPLTPISAPATPPMPLAVDVVSAIAKGLSGVAGWGITGGLPSPDQLTQQALAPHLGANDPTGQTLQSIRDTNKALYDWLQRHEDLFSLNAQEKAILGSAATSAASPGTGKGAGTGKPPGKHPGDSSPLDDSGTVGPGSYAMAASGVPGSPPQKVSGAILQDYINAAGGDQNLLKMMLVQGARESSFQPGVTAPDGGQGIAQFMPDTVASLNSQPGSPFYKKKFNPYDPAQATKLQAYYDQQLLAREGGNEQLALRDYNGSGPAAERYGQQAYAATQTVTVVIEDRTTGGVKATPKVDHNRKPAGHVGSSPPAFVHHGPGGPW